MSNNDSTAVWCSAQASDTPWPTRYARAAADDGNGPPFSDGG